MTKYFEGEDDYMTFAKISSGCCCNQLFSDVIMRPLSS